MQLQTDGVHVFFGLLSADGDDAIVGTTRALHGVTLLWLRDTPYTKTSRHRSSSDTHGRQLSTQSSTLPEVALNNHAQPD